jgi:Bacterial protein of unknown function (DUF937)
MSIISEVMRFLTPQVVNRIADLLGLDKGSVGRMVVAAVPLIIGGLTRLVTNADGQEKLSREIGNQPVNPLESLQALLGGGKDEKAVASGGLGALENLLGDKMVGELAGALSGFGGAKASTSKNLLGMLAPAVLGALANKRRDGLDMKGLAEQMLREKGEIARVLPDGFNNYLKGDLAKGVGLDFSADKDIGIARASSASPSTAKRSSGMSWILPLIIVVLLGLFAWYYFSGRTAEQAAQAPIANSAIDFTALHGIEIGGADLADTLRTSIEGLRSTLAGVTDEATAKEALPSLSNYSSQLEALANGVESIPTDARSVLVTALGGAMPTINELFAKVLALPGVEAVIGPTLSAIRQHLERLAQP